jgi:hypothetical protein
MTRSTAPIAPNTPGAASPPTALATIRARAHCRRARHRNSAACRPTPPSSDTCSRWIRPACAFTRSLSRAFPPTSRPNRSGRASHEGAVLCCTALCLCVCARVLCVYVFMYVCVYVCLCMLECVLCFGNVHVDSFCRVETSIRLSHFLHTLLKSHVSGLTRCFPFQYGSDLQYLHFFSAAPMSRTLCRLFRVHRRPWLARPRASSAGPRSATSSPRTLSIIRRPSASARRRQRPRTIRSTLSGTTRPRRRSCPRRRPCRTTTTSAAPLPNRRACSPCRRAPMSPTRRHPRRRRRSAPRATRRRFRP